MKRHLTLTLTSDHKNNARNESSFIIKTSYDLPSTGVAMLDFDVLQEFPNISSWATKSDFISDLVGTQNHQKTLDLT